MFSRTWLLLFLAGSVALPYALSNSSGLTDAAAGWLGTSTAEQADPPAASTGAAEKWEAGHSQHPPAIGHAAAVPPPARPMLPAAAPATVDAPRPVPMNQVFRFDVTNAWVMGQWPRVSTRLADIDSQGYRVALITGTQPWDLAGALTYYFNKDQRVERITFRGTTGDTRPLVTLLCNEHRFVRKLTDDPGVHLYEVVDRGQSISQLRIMARSVLYNNEPNNRFQIDLVLQRPSWVK
jgi:hypothetical protein